MTALKWLPIGAGVIGLVLAAVFYLAAGRARAQRDEARAELKTAQLAFDVEQASTKQAQDALARITAELEEQGRRCSAAAAVLEQNVARLRASLRQCASADSVAERAGALWP